MSLRSRVRAVTTVLALVLPALLGALPRLTRRVRLMRQLETESKLHDALPEGSEARELLSATMNHTATEIHYLATRLTPADRRARTDALRVFAAFYVTIFASIAAIYAAHLADLLGANAHATRLICVGIASTAAGMFLAAAQDAPPIGGVAGAVASVVSRRARGSRQSGT